MVIDMILLFLWFTEFDDVVRDPGLKTTYEVTVFASDSWRKVILCYHFFLLFLKCRESWCSMLTGLYTMTDEKWE